MKRYIILINVLLFLMLVLLLGLFCDFLALHDISNDYVSKPVIQSISLSTLFELPEWTNTELEWLVLQISYYSKLFIALMSFFVLYAIKREMR